MEHSSLLEKMGHLRGPVSGWQYREVHTALYLNTNFSLFSNDIKPRLLYSSECSYNMGLDGGGGGGSEHWSLC